ncbi:MAG: histidine kinase [Bacteroidales bacterium]|nr:histidine kinase [Bacteroidales bacterium]
MNKEFANVYNLTSKKVGVVSLFLVVLYEIMWLPVDNYDSRLISNLPTFPELIIDIVTCTLQTYLCKTAIKYEARKGLLLKWENITFPMFITILALFCTLLALPITLLQTQLYHSFSIQQWDWQDYYVDVMILSLLSCLLFTISLLVQYIGYVKEVSKSREKEIQAIAETKILALQSQINPHFLFNTLSSAIGYVEYDPKKTTKLLLCLSDVYRHILVRRQGHYTTLKEELDMLQKYMELINIRHGDSVELKINVEEDCLQKGILPSVLQLLSENAIKHNWWDNNTPLHITITNNNNNLVVTNDYRPIDNGRLSLGIGQQNISERYNVLGISGVKFYHNESEYIVEIPLVQSY